MCFGIFAFGFLVSLYDAVRLIRYGCLELVTKSKFFVERNSAVNFKNKFRTVVMFVTYTVGMTLNYFAMNLIRITDYKYGISFWVFFSSLLIFAFALIWESIKLGKIAKQEMIIRLI